MKMMSKLKSIRLAGEMESYRKTHEDSPSG